MTEEFLTLLRFEYDEPDHAEVHLKASNGLFAGYLEYYCSVEELNGLGGKLKAFPASTNDKIVYEIGSEDPKKRAAYYLRLEVRVSDGAGHSVISIRINRNGLVPHNGIAEFSIKANPADLNDLGDLFQKLAKFEIADFSWRPSLRRT